jgi:hypothetical protein
MITYDPADEVKYPTCGTPIGTSEWASHLADLEQLEARAEHIGAYPLQLELAILRLEHLSFQWAQSEDGND